MPRTVKGASREPRRYDRSGRRASSGATRQRILAAAGELVATRGYRGTTLAAIAAGAGVHVDTIYELVGRKPDVVRELVEQALSGTDRAVPAQQRDYVAAIRDEPTPTGKIRIYAAATRAMLVRVAPLFIALRDAAATDVGANELWQAFSDRRAANMREFVADVAATGRLRAGLDPATAADTVWLTNSPEVFVMLTRERGWSAEHFEQWLADSWRRLLLDDPG